MYAVGEYEGGFSYQSLLVRGDSPGGGGSQVSDVAVDEVRIGISALAFVAVFVGSVGSSVRFVGSVGGGGGDRDGGSRDGRSGGFFSSAISMLLIFLTTGTG